MKHLKYNVHNFGALREYLIEVKYQKIKFGFIIYNNNIYTKKIKEYCKSGNRTHVEKSIQEL